MMTAHFSVYYYLILRCCCCSSSCKVIPLQVWAIVDQVHTSEGFTNGILCRRVGLLMDITKYGTWEYGIGVRFTIFMIDHSCERYRFMLLTRVLVNNSIIRLCKNWRDNEFIGNCHFSWFWCLTWGKNIHQWHPSGKWIKIELFHFQGGFNYVSVRGWTKWWWLLIRLKWSVARILKGCNLAITVNEVYCEWTTWNSAMWWMQMTSTCIKDVVDYLFGNLSIIMLLNECTFINNQHYRSKYWFHTMRIMNRSIWAVSFSVCFA